MSEQEILEGNKLIAEFIRWEIAGPGFPAGYATNDDLFYQFHELKFHSSWDWLMPVVEKIEELNRLGGIVQIVQGQCRIISRMAGDHTVMADKSHYMIMGAKGKLLATYEAVVEFIKWYNSCQKE